MNYQEFKAKEPNKTIIKDFEKCCLKAGINLNEIQLNYTDRNMEITYKGTTKAYPLEQWVAKFGGDYE